VPGDVVVGDDDGALVIPPKLAAEVLADALEQECQEQFITEQVTNGHGVEDLYPLGEKWAQAYREWLETRRPVSGSH
jgi:5-oxopent-3-ene-1,2,5-tricarboxylate decarboxylase / 2-hydroxyhepta-2,4-diene-1,7-dioate isomerase